MSAAPDTAAPFAYTAEQAERTMWRLALSLIMRFVEKALRHFPPPPPVARVAIDRLGRVAAALETALCTDDRGLRDILDVHLPRLAQAFTDADAANIVPDDILSFLFDNERPW